MLRGDRITRYNDHEQYCQLRSTVLSYSIGARLRVDNQFSTHRSVSLIFYKKGSAEGINDSSCECSKPIVCSLPLSGALAVVDGTTRVRHIVTDWCKTPQFTLRPRTRELRHIRTTPQQVAQSVTLLKLFEGGGAYHYCFKIKTLSNRQGQLTQ